MLGASQGQSSKGQLMEKLGQRFSWASLPLVATISRLLYREQTLQVEYLRTEVEVLRSRVSSRIRFTDEERRSLVDAALAMGRDAMRAVVSIVKPDTILDWHRKLVQAKWAIRPGGRAGACPHPRPHRQCPLRGEARRPAEVIPPRRVTAATWSLAAVPLALQPCTICAPHAL
jgi:hypothetical protein